MLLSQEKKKFHVSSISDVALTKSALNTKAKFYLSKMLTESDFFIYQEHKLHLSNTPNLFWQKVKFGLSSTIVMFTAPYFGHTFDAHGWKGKCTVFNDNNERTVCYH